MNTLSPAFEREIKGVVSRAPRCRFGGCGMDDIYKLVEVDFPSLMPDTLREDVLCVGRHLPPRFPLKGEKSGYLDGREAFVKWLSSRFRFPRHSDFSGYCDTLSLCYTVSEEGCMEGKHSVNHVFSSPTSIINFTSKKPSYDDTRRSGRDNELLQRAQNDL